MKTKKIRIDRESFMYGIAKVISNNTENNIVCVKTTSKDVLSYDPAHVYGYEMYTIYHYIQDGNEIQTFISLSEYDDKSEKGSILHEKNIDQYLSVYDAKNIIVKMSSICNYSLENLFYDIIRTKNMFSTVDSNSVNKIVEKYIDKNAKVYVK